MGMGRRRENRLKYDIFLLSSMDCQLDRKSSLAAPDCLTVLFNFGPFLNFIRMYIFVFVLCYLRFLKQDAWTAL